MAKKRMPYLQLYTQDLRGEQTLLRCSFEARYIWREMLGFMHEAPDRGFLLHANGDPMTEQDLAVMIPPDPHYKGDILDRMRNCILELEMNGVFSRDRRKIIYNRRMVRDEKKAATARSNGKNGGNPKLKSGDNVEINPTYSGDKSDLEHAVTHEHKKEIPTLDNQSLGIPESRDQIPEKKDNKQSSKPVGQKSDRGTRLPQDWTLLLSLGQWALEQGMTREAIIREAEKFKNYWHSQPGAKGRKIDWDKTFKNWIYTHLERKPTHGTHQKQPSKSDRADAAAQRAIDILNAPYANAGLHPAAEPLPDDANLRIAPPIF